MKIVKTTVAVLFSALMASLVPLRADDSNAESTSNPVSTWTGPADSSEGSIFVDSSWDPAGRPTKGLIFTSVGIGKTALIDKKAAFYGEAGFDWEAYAIVGDANSGAFFGENTTNCIVWRAVKGEKESAADNGLDLMGGIHVASFDSSCNAGALRIEGGTHNVGGDWTLGVNIGEYGVGYLELNSGTINSSGHILVSRAHDGTLVVGNGSQDSEALLSIASNAEKWIKVTDADGVTGQLIVKKGGTVAAKHLHCASGADARLVLDGGTLEHNAACADGTGFLSDGLNIRITANGGTIRADVETEITGDILDDDQASASKGTLVKTGAADLRLAGSMSHAGATEVREGRLVLNAGIQLGSDLTISEGGALVIDLNHADKMEYDLFTDGAGVHLPESAVFTDYVYAINGEAFNVAITKGEGGNVHVSLSVKPEAAVAVIVADGAEDEYRASVSGALAAAGSGKTVRLLRDAVLNEDAVARAGTVFDMKGFKLTRQDDNVSLQLEDGAVVSNGTFATDVVYSQGGDTLFAISNNVSVSMADVNVGDLGGYEPYCALSAVGGAEFEIDGGTWRAATLFASTNNNGHLEIKDGRFFIRAWQRDREKGGTISISGGRFSLAPRRGDVKEGYVVMHVPSDVELPYHVVPASSSLYTQEGWMFCYADEQTAMGAVVAKVGERAFTTVSDAVRAALAGDTVTMVADVRILPEQIAVDKNLTIEGDAHLVKVRSPYVDESGYVTADFTQEFDSVIYVHPGCDVTIRNLHVMGGGVIRGDYDNAGRHGIVNDGVLMLDDVTVTRSNGAVHNRVGGRLRMEDCRIVRNCRHSAGGFYNHGFAVMNRTSLSENRSLNDYGGGGACENGGELYVNNCVICNNSSTEIGGAINNFCTLYGGHPRLYMMNTTVSGNFCATSIGNHNGGGIGVRAFSQPGTFYSLNNLICCNYRVELSDNTIGLSDVAILENYLLKDGMTNKLYYTVFDDGGIIREPGTVDKSVYVNEHAVALSSEEALAVFHGYYASKRVYQNAKTTAMDVKGALLVAKDDGSYASELARYAPIVNAASNRAVLGHDGVYTYFDASEWKSGVVRMSYAPVAGEAEIGSLSAAGEMVSFANLPSAGADCMVTNFYESASGRSFGIAGASGWIEEEKVYYTVKLAGEVTGGKVTGITLFGDSYESGTEITLTATPGYARSFLGWFEDDSETPVSTASVWTFQVLKDRVLQPRFSEPSEVITARVAVHQASEDATEDFPINVTLAWMEAHYTDFIKTIEGLDSVEAKEAKIKELLCQRDETTGWTMWQDYILGVEPGDPNAKLWIDSPQYRAVGREVIRFKMNELTPVDGSGFQIRYRLDAKSFGTESFARGETNDIGVFDVATAEDPSGLYVIDLLFIPDGYLTSEEYVTTVNTAGALRVATDDPCAIVAVPWTALSPSGQNPIAAGNLVRTMNLTTGDKLHVYDKANASYRSWQLRDNGQWEALGTYLLSSDGQVSWESAGKPEATTVTRGSGAWLERQNAEPHVYLVGQYDASEVTTELSAGWNLVGNPAATAYDLSKIVPSEGDGIIVPTAAAPKNMTYADGKWGYNTNTVVKVGERRFVKPVRVTNDNTIPAGTGFWYIRSEDAAETATIDWMK